MFNVNIKFHAMSTEEIRAFQSGQTNLGVQPQKFLNEMLDDWEFDYKSIDTLEGCNGRLIYALDELNDDVASAAIIIEAEGDPDTLTVGLVHTNPRYENMGIASEIYQLMEKFSSGYKDISNQVTEINFVSQDFHKKLGYTKHPIYDRWNKKLDPKTQVGTFQEINNTETSKQFTPSQRGLDELDNDISI